MTYTAVSSANPGDKLDVANINALIGNDAHFRSLSQTYRVLSISETHAFTNSTSYIALTIDFYVTITPTTSKMYITFMGRMGGSNSLVARFDFKIDGGTEGFNFMSGDGATNGDGLGAPATNNGFVTINRVATVTPGHQYNVWVYWLSTSGAQIALEPGSLCQLYVREGSYF